MNSRRKDVAPNDPDRTLEWDHYKDYIGESEDLFPAMDKFKKVTREILPSMPTDRRLRGFIFGGWAMSQV